MHTQIARWFLTLIALVLFCNTQVRAVEPNTFVPNDPDFLIQGEYSGEVTKPEGKKKLGVQIIARGAGKFHAVSYDGGLPGDGWDKSATRESDGQLTDQVATFTSGDDTFKIKGGSLKVENKAGSTIGELPKVTRQSPTLGAKPPQGAVVLFDGKNADQFEGGQIDDGFLKQGTTSKPKFQSGTLHIEFREPYGPLEPARGNSGCYLQGRYEVQILDSFGFKPHNHECGGIPGVKEADLPMSFPPLAWQTYDVDFTAAKFKDGKKEKNARMTVRHNGVLIQQDVEVPIATQSSPLGEGPDPGPINLQEHGSPVRFRNIWFLPKPE
jgi:hypothetical protein